MHRLSPFRALCAAAAVLVAMLCGALVSVAEQAPMMKTEPLTITLHEEALVEGPTITLGDLASLSGDGGDSLARIEINPAPVPGNSRNLTASLIEARIRNAGLEPGAFEVRGPRVVKTTRAHQTLSHRRIEQELEHHILMEMPWDPALAVVDLMVPEQELTLPPGVLDFQWHTNPRYNYLGLGAFRVDVLVDGERERTVLCRANIEAFGEVIVAATQITRGQPLGAGHLRVERHGLSNLPPGAYQHMDEVVGLVARTTILPGQVVTQRRVEQRTLVRRRQLVNVESRSGGLRITTEARALSDGKAGDVIELMNTNSQQVFQGVVLSDGRVAVQ